jgi:hypothetical protein
LAKRKRKNTKALAKRKKKEANYVKYANPRMKRLVSELASGKPPVEAGLAAGYSENYCKTRLYAMMKRSDSFRQLVEKQAKHSVELIRNLYKVNLLPRSFNIDANMLEEFESDPKLAMKHDRVLARIHRIAGTLEDHPNPVQFIDQSVVLNIQAYVDAQQHIYQKDKDEIEGEVVDAKLIQ